MANHTKTFEEYQNAMDCNGYSYFDREAFLNNPDEVCYIPESAEDLTETFSFNDLFKECEEWAENNPDYMTESNITVGELVENLFNNIEWTFPSTYLDGLVY